MLKRLPIALADPKASNTSEKLLNEIREKDLFFASRNKLLKK